MHEWVYIGRSWGHCWCAPPISIQILSFLHSNFLQCHLVRPWHPPWGWHPPSGNPGSATGIHCIHTCMHVHGNALHSICINLETLLEYCKILFLKLYLKLQVTRYRLKCEEIVHVSIHFSKV